MQKAGKAFLENVAALSNGTYQSPPGLKSSVFEASGNTKAASNWVMTEVLRKLKDDDRPLADCPIKPGQLAEMIGLIDKGTISGKIAKDVFEKMWTSGDDASKIVEREGTPCAFVPLIGKEGW